MIEFALYFFGFVRKWGGFSTEKHLDLDCALCKRVEFWLVSHSLNFFFFAFHFENPFSIYSSIMSPAHIHNSLGSLEN